MKVLISGTRKAKGRDLLDLVYGVLTTHVTDTKDLTIVHGGARGIDAIADAIAKHLRCEVIVEPALWDKHGRAAGPIRNQKMLDDQKPDLVLAFPSSTHDSPGTRDMIRRAKWAKVTTVVTWVNT